MRSLDKWQMEFKMKMLNKILATAVIIAALNGSASAQTNYVIVTNFVTVTVTNVVTITNVVPPAPAVVAVAKTPPPPPPVVVPKYPWKNDVSLGLTLTRGNTESETLDAAYLGEKKTPFDEYQIGLAGDYGNLNGKDSVNDYKAFTQWNHLFTDRFFGYVRVDGLRDIIASVDYRVTVGPGAGYYLLKTTNTTLALEAGSAFESQELDHQGNSYFATIRGAERFEHKFNAGVRLWQNVEILPEVDRWDNYIVNFEIGVETALFKSLSLKSYLDDNYNNRPANGRLKNDAKIVTALDYKF